MFKRKKEVKQDVSGFVVEEKEQSYKLMQYGYLYESPTDNYLTLYKQLFDNVPILDSAVTTYSDLICSGWDIKSEDPSEAELIKKELINTNFDKVLKTSMDNYFVYGFYATEIVASPKFDKIVKFQDIPSMQIRIKRDDYANIVNFVQEANPKDILFDPKMVIYSSNRESAIDPYGRSLFKSLPWITRMMLEMQDSMSKIYRRYGSPRFHVKYNPPTQLDQATLQDRLTTLKTKFKDIEVGQDFFTAGDIEVSVIGSGGKEQFKLSIELSEINQSVFSGLKLPAGVLGYNYGSTETHLKKQIEILLGRILSYQSEQEHVLNLKLMPVLATIYNLKNIPTIKFKEPVITDEQEQISIETAKLNYTKTLIDMGMITKEDAQLRLGLPVKTIEAPQPAKKEDNVNA